VKRISLAGDDRDYVNKKQASKVRCSDTDVPVGMQMTEGGREWWSPFVHARKAARALIAALKQ
jgi:hypothetical protein